MSGILSSSGVIIRRGDSFSINLHFTENGEDFNLAGTALKMCAAKEDGSKIMQKDGVISDAGRGLASIELTPQETDIEPGEYLTDIQITLPDGQVHTIFPQDVNTLAYLKITPQVTE